MLIDLKKIEHEVIEMVLSNGDRFYICEKSVRTKPSLEIDVNGGENSNLLINTVASNCITLTYNRD